MVEKRYETVFTKKGCSMVKNIVLVGFMGTGKTTAGTALSRKLNRPFIDTDIQIEVNCNMAIADIFKNHGETFFRQQEKLAIRDYVPCNNAIVAVGGGAVLNPENVINLKNNGIIICLTASPEKIVKRIGGDTTRPLLNVDNKHEVVAKLLRERAGRYRLADFTVDTTPFTPEEVADQIINIIK